jgi:hypothetical protein
MKIDSRQYSRMSVERARTHTNTKRAEKKEFRTPALGEFILNVKSRPHVSRLIPRILTASINLAFL